jgi:hypothetical protein
MKASATPTRSPDNWPARCGRKPYGERVRDIEGTDVARGRSIRFRQSRTETTRLEENSRVAFFFCSCSFHNAEQASFSPPLWILWLTPQGSSRVFIAPGRLTLLGGGRRGRGASHCYVVAESIGSAAADPVGLLIMRRVEEAPKTDGLWGP